MGVLAKLCTRAPRPSIFRGISCKHADTSTPLHSPPDALFIVFGLFILWLFLLMLQYEFNINSTSKASLLTKNGFNRIYKQCWKDESCFVRIQSPRNTEGFHGVLKAKMFFASEKKHSHKRLPLKWNINKVSCFDGSCL